jgi:hypothetical protein
VKGRLVTALALGAVVALVEYIRDPTDAGTPEGKRESYIRAGTWGLGAAAAVYVIGPKVGLG